MTSSREHLLSGYDTPYGYESSSGTVAVSVRMSSCRICGPKLSSCCFVISIWGALMLVLMGAFFRIESVALIEDVAKNEHGHPDWTGTSNNCFIAAGLYVVFFALSWYQKSAISGGKRYC